MPREIEEDLYWAHLSEDVYGDVESARRGYRRVIDSENARPVAVARAALRLAALEIASQRDDLAQELIARAVAAAGDDAELVELADRLRGRLGATRSFMSRRGPPAGTALETSDEVAAAFAKAETQMQAYYRRPLSPRLEGLQRMLRGNQQALDAVVRSYRAVAAQDPLAAVAAGYRIGALYHDSALAMFEVPPELEPRVAARLRRSLRRRALNYLERARSAYEESLAAAKRAGEHPGGKRWQRASRKGLAAVADLLRHRE